VSPARKIFGIILIIARPAVILAGYSNLPSASVCNTINGMNRQLGLASSCRTTPAPGYWVVAVILVLAGLAFLAPWWLRWLADKSTPER